MASDREVEDFARECVGLANLTADPQMRERLFQMAREWMAIAMHPSENARTEIRATEKQLALDFQPTPGIRERGNRKTVARLRAAK
jgi:hypothetical protein